jgi:predicted Rdx family selenoprotein
VDAEHARMKQEIDHFASEAHNDNVIYTAFEKRDGGRKNDYVRSEYIQKISAMTSLVDHRKRLLESVIAKRQKAAAEEETKRRFDEYWKTHKEEKTALEAEKKSLLETVANIIKEIPLIPQKTEGYEEMFQLQKSVENLTAEKNAIGSTPEIVELSQKIEQLAAEKQTLGFFDSKGKKPINEQIVSLEKEIASIQKSKSAAIQEKIDTANNAISPIQARIKQNIKTAYGNISKYQTRIEAIDRKLTIPGSELEELEDIEHMNDTEAYIEEQPQICDKQELCAFCGGEIVRLGFFKVCKSCGEQNN